MTSWLTDTAQALRSPATWHSFRRVFVDGIVDEGWRYLLFALVAWGLLHVLLRRRLAHRVIAGWPRPRDLRREIAYSLSSLTIFAALAAVVLAAEVSGHAEIYTDPRAHGLAWLVLSLPAVVLWHDVYFYWTHRLLHTRWLFRSVHGVHHRSRNPSPWAAYAFHPVEALVNGAPTLLALLVVPLHIGVLFAIALHEIGRNVLSHASIEPLPHGFVDHRFWGLFTTTTHHHLHHETARGNYGLWFTWWDRWCGTERAEYRERFGQVTAPAPAVPQDDIPTEPVHA